MKYYMHTLEGLPAAYMPSEKQICFLSHYGNRKSNSLAKDLKQIRREQKLSREYREKELHVNIENEFKPGYVIVHTPED